MYTCMFSFSFRKGDTAIYGTETTGGDSPFHICTFPADLTSGSDGAAAAVTSQFQHPNVRWSSRSWFTCGNCLLQWPERASFTQTLIPINRLKNNDESLFRVLTQKPDWKEMWFLYVKPYFILFRFSLHIYICL